MGELSTPFTELIGCRLPLQQAGMGGITTPALAAAVARAGGLGMLAAAGLTAEQAVADADVAGATAGPDSRLGANFLMPFLDPGTLEAVSPRVAVVECFYGDPDPDVVDRVHRGGALSAWQVGSVDEASAAADAGCDLVVVQGHEAGGHVRGERPLLALLPEVRATIDLPLVAAGGIGNGEAMAVALRAGADAVRVGTRFVATDEADTHPDYVEALIGARGDDTVLTTAFGMGWPDAPHRVLRSSVEASDAPSDSRSPLPPTRDFAEDVGAAALYAGTSVSDVTRRAPAAEVVEELVREAKDALAAMP